MTLIFLDTNVQVYAAGRPHPLKQPCINVLLLAQGNADLFVTDAEVLQELMHRYLALRTWDPLGRDSLRAFVRLMRGHIAAVYAEDVDLAATFADQVSDFEARDLLHAAIMRRLEVSQIVSADRDFDRFPDIERLDPADVDSWGGRVTAEA